MRVDKVGVLMFDSVRGAYMENWEFDPQGETFISEDAHHRAKLACALEFVGRVTGAIQDESIDEVTMLAIQKAASSRDP